MDGVTGQLGLGCSPLSVVGAGGGNACSAQPVCCQNNNVVRNFLGILGVASVLTAVFLGRPALRWLRAGPALRLMMILPHENLMELEMFLWIATTNTNCTLARSDF